MCICAVLFHAWRLVDWTWATESPRLQVDQAVFQLIQYCQYACFFFTFLLFYVIRFNLWPCLRCLPTGGTWMAVVVSLIVDCPVLVSRWPLLPHLMYFIEINIDLLLIVTRLRRIGGGLCAVASTACYLRSRCFYRNLRDSPPYIPPQNPYIMTSRYEQCFAEMWPWASCVEVGIVGVIAC